MLFGSWLGDWDSEDNIMRAVLALPTYGLACVWSGRPHWYLHHMALGEPIGYGTRLTQNNNGLYQNQVNSAVGQVHVALMGDPTLRLHYVAPPKNLRGVLTEGIASLSWTPSTEAVAGYHVYRAENANGPFTRVTTSPVIGTSYTDPNVARAGNYMVRAVKVEISGGGTYLNLSQGAFLRPIGGSSSGSIGEADRSDIVWISDALPAGAVPGSDGGDSWVWSTNSVGPGLSKTHLSLPAPASRQHFFGSSSATLEIRPGDVLYAWIYLQTNSLPREVMLQWTDGSWEHRAYWGENILAYGQDGTESRRYIGPLPLPGQWVQLRVPASQIGLENKSVQGMAFTVYGGAAAWGAAGRLSSTASAAPDVHTKSLRLLGSGVELSWSSVSNRTYQVLSTTNLAGQWITGAQVTAAGSNTTWIDRSGITNTQRFYRVKAID